MTRAFRLEVRHAGAGHALIAVSGELDPLTAPRLRERGLSLLAEGTPHLLLDMSEVDFCDSSGLSVVIALWAQANASGGSLALAAVPDRLSRLLRMTATDTLIPVRHADDFGRSEPEPS
ncbi:STAS domain-containing protein [Lentzea sp. NPDC042327]|uniref:STAS domain-containing protein n=1 Tax=Lentzea sp. NPDC042327 TaxID=3154801 RepID=UPI00340B3AA0